MNTPEIDHEQFDRTGSIYPQPSIFDHMPEYLGEDKPAEKVTGGSFAIVESDHVVEL